MEIDGGQKIFIFKEDLPYEGRVNFPAEGSYTSVYYV